MSDGVPNDAPEYTLVIYILRPPFSTSHYIPPSKLAPLPPLSHPPNSSEHLGNIRLPADDADADAGVPPPWPPQMYGMTTM